MADADPNPRLSDLSVSSGHRSRTSAELEQIQLFLEGIRKPLSESLVVENILPYLWASLPPEEISNIRQKKTKFAQVQALIHGIVRNIAFGASDAFLHALSSSQPELYEQIKDRGQYNYGAYEIQLVPIRGMPFQAQRKQKRGSTLSSFRSNCTDIDAVFTMYGESGAIIIDRLENLAPNSIRILDFRECKLTDSYIPQICDLLSKQQEVEAVNIDRNYFDLSSLKRILTYVSGLENLIYYSLCDTHYHGFWLDSFTLSLENKSKLVELYLDGCKISKEIFEKLVEVLKLLQCLKHLSLNATNTSGPMLKKLSCALKEKKGIESLYLNMNRISDHCLFDLEPLFQDGNCIQQLSLADNQISNNGVRTLKHIIQKAADHFYLNLCGNQLGTKGARSLNEVWQTNSTFDILDLSNNQIDESSFLQEALQNVQCCGNTTGKVRTYVLNKRMESGEGFKVLSMNDIQLTDEEFKGLEEAICKDGGLERLEIMDNKLTQNSLQSLVNIYHSCPNLRSIKSLGNEGLDFDYKYLERQGLEEYPFSQAGNFVKWWQSNSSHDIFFFQYHKILLGDVPTISDIIQKEDKLKIVSLRGSLSKEDVPENLFKCFTTAKRHIQYLDLSQNKFTDVAVERLVSAFKFRKSTAGMLQRKVKSVIGKHKKPAESALQRVDLESNSITDQGIMSLSEAMLYNEQLVYISFKDNKVKDAGCKVIAKMLKEHTSLQYLSLRDNNIGDEGVEYISQALVSNEKLLELDLGGNKISFQGLVHVGNMLKENMCLKFLDLSRNSIKIVESTSTVFKSFSRGLAKNISLKTLNMADNSIGDIAVALFAEVLAINKTLTALSLASSDIGKEGLYKISELLRANATLLHLNLSGNGNLGRVDPQMSIISKGLKMNNSLTFLGLGHAGMKNDVVENFAGTIGKHLTLKTVDMTGNTVDEGEFTQRVREDKPRINLIFRNDRSDNYLDCYLYTPFPNTLPDEAKK